MDNSNFEKLAGMLAKIAYELHDKDYIDDALIPMAKWTITKRRIVAFFFVTTSLHARKLYKIAIWESFFTTFCLILSESRLSIRNP